MILFIMINFHQYYSQVQLFQILNLAKQSQIMYQQFAQDRPNDFSYQYIRNRTTTKKDLDTNITPTRSKQSNLQNKQNIFLNQTLPNQISKTAAKRNFVMEKPQYCVNHQNRTAQYSIQIDDQIMSYCNKCAAHLASQGFEVQKIPLRQSDRILTNPTPSKNRISPNNFKIQQSLNNQRKFQLQGFMSQIQELKKAYKNKKDYLRKVSQSYEVQKQTVNNYFSSMIQYLEYLREDYLQGIQQQSIKNTQICEIQAGQMTETISQMEEMLVDIDGNVDNIIKDIDQQNYVQCFSYYRQKQGIFQHRLQELGVDAKPWPCTSNEQIEQKLDNFKHFMDDMMQQ